jgi:hypothetical protein
LTPPEEHRSKHDAVERAIVGLEDAIEALDSVDFVVAQSNFDSAAEALLEASPESRN